MALPQAQSTWMQMMTLSVALELDLCHWSGQIGLCQLSTEMSALVSLGPIQYRFSFSIVPTIKLRYELAPGA